MFKRKFIFIVFGTFVVNLILALIIFSLFLPKNPEKVATIFPKPEPLPTEKTYANIVLGGDVMLGRSVNKKGVELKNYSYPFDKIKNILSVPDLVFVNLESPFSLNCPIITGGYTFCADPKMVDALKVGNVGVVNLANNHVTNFGSGGVEDTKKILSDNNISYTGFGNFAVKEIKGTTFGFLGFDYTVYDITDNDIKLIRDSDKKVDVLIIGVHWGDEYKSIHNAKQGRIARVMVESGADVVAGHHPHWIQDMEYIDGKPVFYSLGNLVFDQMWSEETKKGMLVKLKYEGKTFAGYEELPIYIKEVGHPEFY